MTIKALIFDLDGVLVDTMPLHFRAWEVVAERYHRPFDRAMKDSFRGLPQSKCIQRLFDTEALSPQATRDILEQKNNYYQGVIRETSADELLADGVLDLLVNARDAGLKTGIASSSVSARLVVEHTGLIDCVDIVADGMVVSNGKPSSDIFVWVSGALQIPPRECIVFEDGDAGLRAAQQAGMLTVGIGTGDWLKQANWQFPDMSFIQLNDLLQEISIQDNEAIKET